MCCILHQFLDVTYRPNQKQINYHIAVALLIDDNCNAICHANTHPHTNPQITLTRYFYTRKSPSGTSDVFSLSSSFMNSFNQIWGSSHMHET